MCATSAKPHASTDRTGAHMTCSESESKQVETIQTWSKTIQNRPNFVDNLTSLVGYPSESLLSITIVPVSLSLLGFIAVRARLGMRAVLHVKKNM